MGKFLRILAPVLLAVGLSSCTGRPAERQTEYRPVATISELMVSLIDPAADEVWNAVAFSVDKSGTHDKSPRTEEEWAEVRRAAIRLVEASNLLVTPGRRVGRPGERSEYPGIELHPEEIDELIAKDRTKFENLAHSLQEQALKALAAIDEKNVDKLTDVGGEIDGACETCHLTYWYPHQEEYGKNEKKN